MATLIKGPRANGSRALDLAVLHPDRQVLVRGELWTVREYSMLESARLYALGDRARISIEEGKPDWPVVVALIAEATGKDGIEVAALADADFDNLFAVWREIDLPLFEPVPEKPGKGLPWSEVYAALIAAGHDAERVGKYTARQTDLYYRVAMKLHRRQRAERISDVNLAMAGGSSAKSRVQELQQGT